MRCQCRASPRTAPASGVSRSSEPSLFEAILVAPLATQDQDSEDWARSVVRVNTTPSMASASRFADTGGLSCVSRELGGEVAMTAVTPGDAGLARCRRGRFAGSESGKLMGSCPQDRPCLKQNSMYLALHDAPATACLSGADGKRSDSGSHDHCGLRWSAWYSP